MKVNDHIAHWNHASIKVLDIRCGTLESGEELPEYRLPASAFLYIQQGSAQVQLDDKLQFMSRNYILHGGRGARLHITAEERFEYYLILYKAVMMLPLAKRQQGLIGMESPFLCQYSFVPQYPLPILEKLRSMYENWMKLNPLDAFHARTLFYQFVHELLSQMQLQGIRPVHPDLLAQVLRYMNDHYMKPLSLETVAELFDCSVSYLTKLFKKRMGESPIRYLTHIRMEKSAAYLSKTDISLQHVAELVGYPDAHTLNRSFRKSYGMTPTQFRTACHGKQTVSELPKLRMKSALVAADSRCYSVNDYENDYHLGKRRGLSVNRVYKSTSMATATLLLCLTLLISACSAPSNSVNNQSGGNSNGAAVTGTTQGTNIETPKPTEAVAATRTYTDGKGTVTIPADPKRIIDLTGSAIGNLLALDIKPVAATRDSLQSPFHEGKLNDIVDMGEEPSAEAILNLNPDLIIAFDYIDEAEYEKLARIAPVVRLKYGAGTPSELLMEFGKITGREELAQQWVQEWNAKIAEVKPKIQAVVGDKTVSILQPYAKGIYAWGNKGGRGGEIIHGDLGLKAPKIIQDKLIDGSDFGADFTLELLPEYAGDYIFTSNWGWDDGDANVVYDSKLWKSLPAVKNNHVYWINEKGSYYNDPISLEGQLDFIVKSFLGE
ncbi:AraC family transcriptional regulator [Paenibacillus gorillae]|uniref:AraC family transcriptional regulator n=1 Tax=Paenibacillus gorillae TaxID=1243662 RepID=UPI0004B6F3C3|nr:AraC family transcriptional regulator [Paenibacillus gorillae]